jgi:hypothetical protein
VAVIGGLFQSQYFIPRTKDSPPLAFVPMKKVTESIPFSCSTAACRALSYQYVRLIYLPTLHPHDASAYEGWCENILPNRM